MKPDQHSVSQHCFFFRRCPYWRKGYFWLYSLPKLLGLWLLGLLLGCAQLPPSSAEQLIPRLRQPQTGQSIQLVRQQNYLLGYYEAAEQPAWVLYELLASELNGQRWKRSNNFRKDEKVLSGSASLDDYRKSGYDKGHLAPAADMAFSKVAMSESFYLSNMSPQQPDFNRGIWHQLEILLRSWALEYHRIIIVTAGIVTGELAQNLPSIGENQVWVPRYYYKVIYDPQRQSMIAFLLENHGYKLNKGENLSLFATTVDNIEKLSGLDFFPQLPDRIEETMESQVELDDWDFDDEP